MKHELITITPQMAEAWLVLNQANYRQPNKGYIERLATDMEAGAWKENGETIKFNGGGLLKDGQHRLMACVKAKTAFKSLVVWGVEDDSTIDIGCPRSLKDELRRRGEKHYVGLGSCILLSYWILPNNNMVGYSTAAKRPTHRVLLSLFEQHPLMRQSVAFASNHVALLKLIRRSVLSALHYAFSLRDAELNDKFWQALEGKLALDQSDPVMQLRRMCFNRAVSKGKISARQEAAYCILAWNHWRNGTTVKILKWAESGPTAQKFPNIV
jgi:hypothetical protein